MFKIPVRFLNNPINKFQALVERKNNLNKKPWGWLCSIDLQRCNPDKIRSKENIRKYSDQLCSLISMTKHGEPQIEHFGEDDKKGYTLVQLITTSNLIAHFSEDTNSAYIDIFSCKEFDPVIASKFTATSFEAAKCVYDMKERGN